MSDVGILDKDVSSSCIFDFPDRTNRPTPPDPPPFPNINPYPWSPMDDWPHRPPPIIPDPYNHPPIHGLPPRVHADAIIIEIIPLPITAYYTRSQIFIGNASAELVGYLSYAYSASFGGNPGSVTDSLVGRGSPANGNGNDAISYGLFDFKNWLEGYGRDGEVRLFMFGFTYPFGDPSYIPASATVVLRYFRYTGAISEDPTSGKWHFDTIQSSGAFYETYYNTNDGFRGTVIYMNYDPATGITELTYG